MSKRRRRKFHQNMTNSSQPYNVTGAEPTEQDQTEESPATDTTVGTYTPRSPTTTDTASEPTAAATTTSLADHSTEALAELIRSTQTAHADRLLAVKEYRRRVELPEAWSSDAVTLYVRQGVEPAKTTTGVWVTDITRPNRPAGDWSTAELQAWILEEIAPSGKATDSTLALAARERFRLKTNSNHPAAIREAYHNNQVEYAPDPEPVTDNGKTLSTRHLGKERAAYIDEVLENYYQSVKPRRVVSQRDGIAAQRRLDRLFYYILALKGPAIKEGLDRLLRFVRNHLDDIFHPDYAHRFTRSIPGSKRQTQCHVNLVEILRVAADSNRARRRQIDLRRMLRGHKERDITNLVDYFERYS